MDYRYMESPLGRLLLAGEGGRLHCIGLPDGKGRVVPGKGWRRPPRQALPAEPASGHPGQAAAVREKAQRTGGL